MFNLSQLLQSSNEPFFWLKIILGILLLMYTIFTFVIFIQTRSMKQLVNQQPLSFLLEVIALAHFVAAFSLFLYTIFIL